MKVSILLSAALTLAAGAQLDVKVVRNQVELNAAIINAINNPANHSRHIRFGNDIDATSVGTHPLLEGSEWFIDGNGFSYNGRNVQRGFILIGAKATFHNLTIRNTKAIGGEGGESHGHFPRATTRYIYHGGGGGLGGKGGDGALPSRSGLAPGGGGGGGGGIGQGAFGASWTLVSPESGVALDYLAGRGGLRGVSTQDSGGTGAGGGATIGRSNGDGSQNAGRGGLGGGGGGGATEQIGSNFTQGAGGAGGFGGGGGGGGSLFATTSGRAPAGDGGFGGGGGGGFGGNGGEAGFAAGRGAYHLGNNIGAGGGGGGGLGAGAGIFAANGSEVTLDNVTFFFNVAEGGCGGELTIGDQASIFSLGGGGGAGLGGAVFIMGKPSAAGAPFVVSVSHQGSQVGGTTLPGLPGASTLPPSDEFFDAEAGQTAGPGYFLQGFGSLRFTPECDGRIVIADAITDETGSGLTGVGATSGEWGVVLREPSQGTVEFQSENHYAGWTEVFGGTLRLSGSGDLGSGLIRIKPTGTLAIANTFEMENNLVVIEGGTIHLEAEGIFRFAGNTIDRTDLMSFEFDIASAAQAGFIDAGDSPFNPNGARLHLSFVNDYVPSAGDETILVQSDSEITTTFDRLPEGAVVWSDGFLETLISYQNNQVSLVTSVLPVLTVSGNNFAALLAQAEMTPGKEVINLNGQAASLNAEAVITGDLNIVGPGTIQGDGSDRLLKIESGADVWLDRLTLRGGRAQPGIDPQDQEAGGGGAIHNNGSLTLTNCTLVDNRAAQGAAAASSNLTGGRGGHGGALLNQGSFLAENCTFYGNQAGLGDKPLDSDPAFDGAGGAIYTIGEAEIRNCTITGNQAGWEEGPVQFFPISVGGLWGDADFAPRIFNSLIIGNLGYQENDFDSGLKASDLAGFPLEGPPASRPSAGNIVGYSQFTTTGDNEAMPVADLRTIFILDGDGHPELAQNGGSTETVALAPLSPALNRGRNEFVAAFADQRGQPRIQGESVDLGAFESQSSPSVDYAQAILADEPLVYWRMATVPTLPFLNLFGEEENLGSLGNLATGGFRGGVMPTKALLPNQTASSALQHTSDQGILVTEPFDKFPAGSTGFTTEFWLRLDQEIPDLGFDTFFNLVGDGVSGDDFTFMTYLVRRGNQYLVRPHIYTELGSSFFDSTISLAVGETYHIVSRWDQDNQALDVFIDGNASGKTLVGGVVPPNATGTTPIARAIDNRIFIGRDGRTPVGPLMTIDEVALYNRPLSDAEISEHYQAGVNGAQLGEDLNGDGIPLFFELANGLDPSINNALLDPDGDGLTVMEEFAFGLRADRPDSSGSLVEQVPLEIDGSRFLAITYPCNPNAQPYLQVTPQRVNLLGAEPWSPGNFSPFEIEVLPDGRKRLTCHSMIPIDTQNQEFIRLEVSQK